MLASLRSDGWTTCPEHVDDFIGLRIAAKLAKDPALKEILTKLRDEEEVHADFLAEQYKKLEKLGKR